MNIFDIAKKSGVSTATVSRVINGQKNVRPATRERVMQVIEREHYRPNAFARGLSTDSMRLVGLLCTDLKDAFFAKAVGILQGLLYTQGYSVLLGCTGESLSGKKKQLDFMTDKHVDAVFLIGSSFCGEETRSCLAKIAKSTPLFVIHGNPASESVYSFYCREEEAVADAVRFLWETGCRRILYLYDAMTLSATSKRNGYVRGVRENGGAPDEALMIRAEKSIEGGRAAVAGALAAGSVPDGVIASEDILAVGALKELQARGVKARVIGFNNSFLCECTTPTLTSIDNKLSEMCEAAVRTMQEVLRGEQPPNRVLFRTELMLRESTE